MGSCSSCAERDEPDNHPTKFKVKNVDDDGNELESGIMEITDQEIILHTRKRDAVRWPYTCLRRYGYDSNLFSFESGRRCQTGQGIFAFKCARAEEMFNLLQENMQCNRINVREEPTRDRLHSHAESELPRTPYARPPPGYGQQYPRRMSYEESSSHPSSRHPSVGSARLPSVGEESTHPLIVPDEQVHTYVNTSNVHEELGSRAAAAAAAAASTTSAAEPGPATGPRGSMEERNPQVQLESQGAKFILGPTPAQKRELERRRSSRKEPGIGNSHGAGGNNNRLVYENVNGLPPQTPGAPSSRAAVEVQNGNPVVSAAVVVVPVGGRTLQNYENWPTLPSVREEPAVTAVRTPLRNGYHPGAAGLVDAHAPVAGKGHSDLLRKREAAPTVFSFEFRRGSLLQHHHHHHVELDEAGSSEGENGGGGGAAPRTPRTPGTPLPQTPTRRTEVYATIDLEKTAAMSSLQRALPRDDGTVRKTRHNSTDPPM
uniref:Fibroblast growth factor receptor substrate 2a n=1 Tax=Petromyzon marinus TaxID=7757 RepID=S4RGV5_PETMA